MSNNYFTDNKNGKITKNVNGQSYTYNILVGKNIQHDESILDYFYYQHDGLLVSELESHDPNAGWQFCSGTCVAMALAIATGNRNITPLDVLYWGYEDSDKRTDQWTWQVDEKNGVTYALDCNDNRIELNWNAYGIRDWEINNSEDQIYTNKKWNLECGTYNYETFSGELIDEKIIY